MNQEIILVDEQDNELGYGEKMDIHRKGLLHRAFSIFIFDWTKYEMLLQKRAQGKYHSGGLWANACCSHPRKDETMEDCLSNRLKEELGLDVKLNILNPQELGLLMDGPYDVYSCGKFHYFAQFEDVAEHEIDHVFLYSPDMGLPKELTFTPNPEEIEELRWVNIIELKAWMEEKPEEFSAWFKEAFELAYSVICRQARNKDMFFSR